MLQQILKKHIIKNNEETQLVHQMVIYWNEFLKGVGQIAIRVKIQKIKRRKQCKNRKTNTKICIKIKQKVIIITAYLALILKGHK